VSAVDEGFAVIPGALSNDETDALARDLTSETLSRLRAGARHILAVPAIAALARDPYPAMATFDGWQLRAV
jgi:hypothetical protein